MEEYMSESSTNKEKSPFQRVRVPVILIAVLVVVTGLIFAGGYFLLPGAVKLAYQDRDCEKVLSRGGLFTRLYPAMIADEETAGMVRECAVYILAARNEEAGMWRESYDAYRVYTETYPQGLFARDAHEHAAVVLVTLARDEVSQEKYSEAEGDILSLLEGYADTAAASEAVQLRSDLQMGLGARLRESGEFPGAEQVFKEVNTWAQENKETEFARSSQLELAQTYLEWGQALQEQGRFAEARVKFDDAVSTDPDPSSPSGPAAQVRTSQAELYIQWGDHLIQQKDFANAMKRYETASMLLGDANPAAANDIVASGYLQWADEAVAAEDFLGALVLLDFAQERAATDSTRTMVEDARSDWYLAFSRSSGEQAQKALQDAIVIVCKHHTRPPLPIFGLDGDSILAGVYGINSELPEDITASTPGSLHFVACVDEDTKVVGSAVHAVGSFVFDPGAPYGLVQVLYERHQYVWNVSLRKADTGEEFALTLIEGGEPPPLPNTTQQIYEGAKNPQYFGPKPDIADLAGWLETAMN